MLGLVTGSFHSERTPKKGLHRIDGITMRKAVARNKKAKSVLFLFFQRQLVESIKTSGLK
jgi:hypothetical protein